MWTRLWRKWTVDKPAAFGDLLWEVFVVQFAAWLDGLTLRRIIAFIPVAIIVLAYLHRIPIPPELMLVGDLLAYIDVFSMIVLLSVWSRVATLLFVFNRSAAGALRLARGMLARVQRLDVRHPREGGTMTHKRPVTRGKNEDDEPAAAYGIAWA